MPKVRDEDKDKSTSRDGVTVAFRLAPIEDRALKALIAMEQAEIDARGAPYRASAASVLRTLLRAKAVVVGVWDTGRPVSPAPPAVSAPVLSADTVREQVLSTLKALHAEKDTHDILTIPQLKAALPNIPGDRINATLLELEGTRDVFLKIAGDPTTVSNPEQGFRVKDRGLVYFIFLEDSRQRTIFEVANPEKSAPTPTPPAPKKATKKELSDDDLIDLIKQAQSAGVSLAEIGRHLGYESNAGSTIGRWVSGKQKISVEKRPDLLAYLKEKGL
jgi:hypothetical protein